MILFILYVHIQHITQINRRVQKIQLTKQGYNSNNAI